ncbi:MAG: NAD-dependent epimerase/dehydratase family protein [Thermodesulfobacteriota bacterium]
MSAQKRKKPIVMVTGAGGVLARHVMKRIKSTHDVVAVDFRWKVEAKHAIATYHADMAQRGFEDIFREHDISGVIHLGRVVTTVAKLKARYNANVLGTKKLFDKCIEYNAGPVLVLSSFFVYGAHPFNPALLDEEAPLKASDLTHHLVDSVELENLSNIYLWRYPKLGMVILRPCNIAGPGVRNNIGRLLDLRTVPVIAGFSPVMQFIHVEDLADAIVVAFRGRKPGIYNVSPPDCIAYKDAVELAGCRPLPLPSVPSGLPRTVSRLLGWKALPSYLVNYFKFPTIIDGSLFEKTFGWKPQYSLEDIFSYYRNRKHEEKLRAKFVKEVEVS